MFSAAVQQVDPPDVPVGHALPLANLDVAVGDGGDGFPAIDGEGCSFIVHYGGVVVGSVEVVGVLLVEVVGRLWVDVLPVDPDVVVAVAPGLLVLEAQSVVDLVLDDAKVDAALPVERQDLLPSLSAQRREASVLALDADVVVLVLTVDKADTGLAVEGPQGISDQLPFPAAVLTADGEGNRHQAVVVFLPQAALVTLAFNGISAFWKQDVSFQQDLVAAIVCGQNPGGDIDGVVFLHLALSSSSFLHERMSLREAEQEQQADRGTHLQSGSGSCGASLQSCCGETPRSFVSDTVESQVFILSSTGVSAGGLWAGVHIAGPE